MCWCHHPARVQSNPALPRADERHRPRAGNSEGGKPQMGLPGGSMGVRGISTPTPSRAWQWHVPVPPVGFLLQCLWT